MGPHFPGEGFGRFDWLRSHIRGPVALAYAPFFPRTASSDPSLGSGVCGAHPFSELRKWFPLRRAWFNHIRPHPCAGPNTAPGFRRQLGSASEGLSYSQ